MNRDLDNGQRRQLRGITQQEPWLFTTFTRYCPDCLAGDGSLIQQRHGGPWKKLWRVPVLFACTQHRRLLDHRCPDCHQLILSGRRGPGLLPRIRDADLHPAQCRVTSTARGFTTQHPPACGARLDTTNQQAARHPSPHQVDLAFAVQDKILDLLDPQGTATTHSLGHQVPASCYFTDLRIVAGLISASWPAALDVGRAPATGPRARRIPTRPAPPHQPAPRPDEASSVSGTRFTSGPTLTHADLRKRLDAYVTRLVR